MVYRDLQSTEAFNGNGIRSLIRFWQIFGGLATLVGNSVKAHVTTSLLILGCVVYGVMEYRAEQESQHVYATMQRNDFLFVDYYQINPASDPIYRYIPLKVLRVNEDTIVFKVGNIAHTTPVSPRKHVQYDAAMRRNFFKTDALTLPISTVNQYIEQGVVYAGRRPKTMYIDGWIAIHKFEIVPIKE